MARDEEVTELTMQNKSCQCQLAEAHSRIAELEARSVSSYQSLCEVQIMAVHVHIVN